MTLEDCRAFYAQEIRFSANLTTPGLVEAFARIPREKFLGPAPCISAQQKLAACRPLELGRCRTCPSKIPAIFIITS
jgi:protein-L-isoaspartate O-methyltransferase